MDGQTPGRQTCRIGDCGVGFADDGTKGSKNEFKPHLSGYWKIPAHQCTRFRVAEISVLRNAIKSYIVLRDATKSR